MGASWGRLGPSLGGLGPSWGGLGGSLGPSWEGLGGLLGRLGGALGPLLGLLGPLGTVLGPSWDSQITRSTTRSIFDKFPVGFGPILGSKMPPQIAPKRPLNETKIKTKIASFFYRS